MFYFMLSQQEFNVLRRVISPEIHLVYDHTLVVNVEALLCFIC